MRSFRPRQSRLLAKTCWPGVTSSWPALNTRSCRNRTNTAHNSGRPSMLSCLVHRGFSGRPAHFLSAAEDFQRRLMHAPVACDDDATATLCRAVVPCRDNPTGAGDDRDDRDDIVGLDFGLDDEINQARRQHAIGVAIAAVARQLH